jgi:FKBP12-rapamycin complex-associated protein
VLSYLNMSMQTLLNVLKKDSKNEERPSAFIALGEISRAVGTNIKPYLDQLIALIKNALNVKSKGYCIQALTCVSMISSVVGPALQKDIHEIIGTHHRHSPFALANSARSLMHVVSASGTDLMFTGGLNPTLTEALAELAVNMPSMLPHIQDKLMDHLSMVLAGKPFMHPGNRAAKFRKMVNLQAAPGLSAQPVPSVASLC